MCRYVAGFNLHLKLLRDSSGLESLAQNIKGFYRGLMPFTSQSRLFSPCTLLSTCREKCKKDQNPKENEKQAPCMRMRKKPKTTTPTTKQPQASYYLMHNLAFPVTDFFFFFS